MTQRPDREKEQERECMRDTQRGINWLIIGHDSFDRRKTNALENRFE